MTTLTSIVVDPEIRADLLAEIREHLAVIESTFRSGPVSRERIDAAFRGFHSIKSLAGFLGLHSVAELAHSGESALAAGTTAATLLCSCTRIRRLIPPRPAPVLRGLSHIGLLFRSMAEVARSVGLQLGKPVVVELAGEELNLDPAIVERLTEPLLHIVRNAVSHGIEVPHVRAAKGKPASGTIRLSAAPRPCAVVIEAADDGAGIPADILGLIFQPGFSTAATVSRISGRGLGLDIVRRQVEKLGGRVHVDSAEGTGTTFLLSIPIAGDRAA
jgi:two-component system chemotaxis sensor kinase CheA